MAESKKILLVEDDERDIELTLSVLEKHNISDSVAVMRDGEQALDYLYRRGKYKQRPHHNPVVILLDVKMPKMSGIEVLREIKSDRSLKSIPVVMLTSSREKRDMEECYRIGVNAYVVKPMNFRDFAHSIREISIFWVMINETV